MAEYEERPFLETMWLLKIDDTAANVTDKWSFDIFDNFLIEYCLVSLLFLFVMHGEAALVSVYHHYIILE